MHRMGKVKFNIQSDMIAQKGSRSSALRPTVFLISALDGVGGQRHAPATLPP